MIAPSVAVTAWSCVSPFGLDRADFLDGISGRRAPCRGEGDPSVAELPEMPRHVVPGFDTRTLLGAKGTRTLDRLTALSIATLSRTLAEVPLGPDEDRDRVGIVLGSSQGSVQSTVAFVRDTLIHGRPDYVNPALFPNTVMNCAAGQTAIWHQCRGPNVTLSAGHLSGLAALRYATQSLRLGYGDLFFAGGAEEMTPAGAWAFYRTTTPEVRGHGPLAEGCALFALEAPESAARRGRSVLAHVLGTELATYAMAPAPTERDKAAALQACAERLMRRCGVAAEEITDVCCAGYTPALEAVERAAVDGLRPSTGWGAEVTVASPIVGNGISVSNAFQTAMLLGRLAARTGGGRARAVGLVTAMDQNGTLGCLLASTRG